MTDREMQYVTAGPGAPEFTSKEEYMRYVSEQAQMDFLREQGVIPSIAEEERVK